MLGGAATITTTKTTPGSCSCLSQMVVSTSLFLFQAYPDCEVALIVVGASGWRIVKPWLVPFCIDKISRVKAITTATRVVVSVPGFVARPDWVVTRGRTAIIEIARMHLRTHIDDRQRRRALRNHNPTLEP